MKSISNQVWKKAESDMILVVVILLLLLTMIVTSYYLFQIGEQTGILPEIVGFCLEGIFFVCIVTLLQSMQAKREKQRFKQTLVSTLGIFVRDYVWWIS